MAPGVWGEAEAIVTTDLQTFGTLLRRFRTTSGLTQEELAERAGLSVRGISDLERDVNRAPYRATLARLVEAMELNESDARLLEGATLRRRGPESSTPQGSSKLPLQLTTLIGREHDGATVTHLLRWEGRRLLTITGPGGVGKTRLAIEVAARMEPEFSSGTVFVALAAVRDPSVVLAAIAAAIGLREMAGRSLRESLVGYLEDRELLLLLDNMEQVVEAAPLIASLLADCARVKALVTSRAPLRLRGEQCFDLSPLAVPSSDVPNSPLELAHFPSVALFVERAQSAKPEFVLSPHNGRAIADICRRVDGLPLAIELAAARLRILSPSALLARLDSGMHVLSDGSRDVVSRQQTMRNTIAWSHDLLDKDEQSLFRRIAVFSGGCTVESAEALHHAEHSDGRDTFEVLSSLVDQNLVMSRADDTEEPRFTMLETIKEFAREQLEMASETHSIRRRHCTHFLELAERAGPELRGPNQDLWSARLGREYGNIRGALQWSCSSGETEIGLRIAGAIWWFWYARGYLSEGRGWIEQLLAASTHARVVGEPRVRANALRAAGILATEQGDYAHAETSIAEGLSIFRELNDLHAVATLLTVLGNIAKYQTDFERATTFYSDALHVFRELGDDRSISVSLNNLGNVAKEQSDYARAVSLYDESLAMKRKLGDTRGIAIVLNNIGTMAHAQGDDQRAVAAGEESVVLLRELGDKDLAAALDTLARAVLSQGHLQRALELYREGLIVSHAAGERQLMAFCIEGLGRVASADGDPDRAALLYGAGIALHEAIGAPLSPAEQAQDAPYFASARQSLGQDGFDAAWERGRTMELDHVIAYALEPSRLSTRREERTPEPT